MTAATQTRWLLKEVMDSFGVQGKELAAQLGATEATISRLRQHRTIPQVGGDRIDQIAAAITAVTGQQVTGLDLIGGE